MVPNLFFHKKLLIQKVFEKAKLETKQSSFSGVLKDLEIILRDDYRIPLSYKTFENYYKNIVEENRDYKIKPETLDELSLYLNEKNFDDFCLKHPLNGKEGVNISVTENAEQIFNDNLNRVTINITNSPVFNLPEFISRHKNSFGLAGILLVVGIFFNQPKIQENIEENSESIKQDIAELPPAGNIEEKDKEPQKFVIYNTVKQPESKTVQPQSVQKTKECMYWTGDHFEPAFCDEFISGAELIALNEEKAKALRKITLPDTLNEENALEKVWYSKSQNKIEFFTAPGLHPENGKTLKPVTKYIIGKYINNK